jgi:3-oxoacyl-[acyl-carrier-protein] synthase II
MQTERAVVTGCGIVSPVGHTVAEFWSALATGTTGIRRISRYAPEDLPVQFAGEVVDFEPTRFMAPRMARRLDRYAQFALAATAEAVEQAKLELDDEERAARTAVLVGSGYGATQQWHAQSVVLHTQGRRKMSPYFASTGALDNASAEIAVQLGAHGQSAAIVAACATGAVSVGEGLRLIRHGYADVVIAGGSDDGVNPIDLSSCANAGAITRRDDDPAKISRPFDRGRAGFVMGAGAGVVILESETHARARGAEILAEVAGYAGTTDAFHSTRPHPEGLGARRAMTMALDDAGLRPDEIDYISAHGTSTQLNDRIESAAIRAVFGDHAPSVPISSIKSMTGHMIGAAGTVELIAAIQSIRTGIIPPTLNCDDPEDPGLDYVPHHAREHRTRTVLSNSFGFGGHNAVLVVRELH